MFKTLFLGTCFLAACVDSGSELASTEQASGGFEVPADVVRELNEVGTPYTGITYSQPPAIDGQSQPLALTSRPFEGLVRDYHFPDVSNAFDFSVKSLPPGPILPPGPTTPPSLVARVFAAGGTTALGALLTPPPTQDRGPIVRSTLGDGRFVSIAELEMPDAELGTSGALSIKTGVPGENPLVTITALPPSVNETSGSADRVTFRVRGSNFTVVGRTVGTQIAFDIYNADGRNVGSYAAQR